MSATSSPRDEADKARRTLLARDRQLAAELIREYGLAWEQIKSELDRITGEIKAARDRGETVNRGWLLKQGRLAQLERQAEAQVRVFADFAERRITQEQLDAVMLGQIDAERLVVASLGPSPSPLAGFTPHLPVGAANQVIGYSSAGQPLGLLLAELAPAAGKAVRSALIRGVVLGKNPRDTARLLRGALGGNMARALTIARTETLRAYREAQRLTYVANRGVVTGWTWHSALDRRTCPVCWAMHGSFHPLDEPLGSHPNCRCAMIPATKPWSELGFPTPIRDTRYVPKLGPFVFAELDEAAQLAILGPGKFAAYTAGDIILADLVKVTRSPRFGTGRAERSLRDVLRRAV